MKCLIFLLFASLFFGCQSNQNANSFIHEVQETVDSITPVAKKEVVEPSLIDLENTSVSYDSLLVGIQAKKTQLKKAVANESISIDSVGNYFAHLMVKEIFPYWKGTPWDFNGHTDIPQKDQIACGYFVSTPLKHVGFKLNRYKLAQQASSNIVKSLALINKVHFYNLSSKDEMIDEIIKNFKDGLYVVGLSNHVGFLYLQDEELYFIHSNYAEPFGVVAEIASESGPFTYSGVYYIAPISNNRDLMRKWLDETSLIIVGT